MLHISQRNPIKEKTPYHLPAQIGTLPHISISIVVKLLSHLTKANNLSFAIASLGIRSQLPKP